MTGGSNIQYNIYQVEYCLSYDILRYIQHYYKLHTEWITVSGIHRAGTQLEISSWSFINPLILNVNTKAQHGGAHFNVLIKNPAKDESPHSPVVQSWWAVRRSRRDGQRWLAETQNMKLGFYQRMEAAPINTELSPSRYEKVRSFTGMIFSQN